MTTATPFIGDEPILPKRWETIWEKDRVAFLKKLIGNLRYSFLEDDMDVCFYLPYRKGNKAYASMGVRKRGQQPNGNNYSWVIAFGFFVEHAMTWSDDYINSRIERVVSEYENFLRGKWPVDKVFDEDVQRRIGDLPLFNSDIEDDPLS